MTQLATDLQGFLKNFGPRIHFYGRGIGIIFLEVHKSCYKDRKELTTDYKKVYQAFTLDEAELKLAEFSDKWEIWLSGPGKIIGYN